MDDPSVRIQNSKVWFVVAGHALRRAAPKGAREGPRERALESLRLGGGRLSNAGDLGLFNCWTSGAGSDDLA